MTDYCPFDTIEISAILRLANMRLYTNYQYIQYIVTYAQNMTSSTDEPMSSTMEMNMSLTDPATTMYTTQSTEESSTTPLAYETVPYDAGDDPTNDFTDCDYYFMMTFDNADDIEASICGYTDDELAKVDIKLDIPSDRWVVFGMKADVDEVEEPNEDFANYDGYNVVIPINSPQIVELYFTDDPVDEPIELEPTIDITSDMIKDNRRMLRLTRDETITDFNDTIYPNASLSYYFNYEDFSGCEDIARISVTYGPTDGTTLRDSSDRFQNSKYDLRESKIVGIDEDGGDSCDDEQGDDAPQFINIFAALIIGFIAMLF